ncbi:TLR adapter interacting with SLC15A4 on the lysosome-like [Eleutherodactylus coqui]|uniref:TLR adapter interacting with SLC15A4 on the lysosome-like n=1 Tax=Eleutherodactylus coqui TaxID=57060 RepID=UPI003462A02B
MLSESFLRTAVYRELLNADEQKGEKKELQEKKRSSWKRRSAGGVSSDRRQLEVLYHGEPSGAQSQALSIPKREALSDATLDLYTSWSNLYGSIYKNYPDLHIGGDHILHKVDSGCILDADCEDGPVLLSADIDNSSSPPKVSLWGLLDKEGPPSVESHTLLSAPASNSVLNGFIEKKMQELYKQCYEETLTANASPQTLLWSTVLMHNIHQISLQISQEHNMDHSKATEAVLQCLCCATSGGSSEFITPILHISSQDSKAKVGAPSSNSALIMSGRVHSKK